MHNIRTVSVCVRISPVLLFVHYFKKRYPNLMETHANHGWHFMSWLRGVAPRELWGKQLVIDQATFATSYWLSLQCLTGRFNFTGLWKKKNLRSGHLVVASVFCLSAFAKLRKVTINLVVSVCPSPRLEQLCYHWTNFHEIWHLSIFFFFFRKSVEKFSAIKIGQE